MNYINIIKLFEQFANKHKVITRFKSDTLSELPDFTSQNEKFPILYIVPVSQNIIKYISGYKSIRYTFNIYCLTPIIQLKKEESNNVLLNQTNINTEITSQVLIDLYNCIDDLDELEFVYDVTLYPVNNYSNSSLQGLYGIYTFDVEYTNCDIPMDGDLTVPKFVCDLNPYFDFGYIENGYVADE